MATELRAKSTYKECFAGDTSYIVVSGIIGAGKTTLVKKLAETMGFEAIYEPVETNPYLSLFYEGMKEPVNRYAFPMQIYLLNERFDQHQMLIWSGKNVIQDRSIFEDLIFGKMLAASGKMSALDFETYRRHFMRLGNYIHRPDLIIYLDTKPEIALERIKARGRECEKDLPLEYLRELEKGYLDWIDTDICGRIPVLRLDWNTFIPTDEVVAKIKEKLKSPVFKSMLKL